MQILLNFSQLAQLSKFTTLIIAASLKSLILISSARLFLSEMVEKSARFCAEKERESEALDKETGELEETLKRHEAEEAAMKEKLEKIKSSRAALQTQNTRKRNGNAALKARVARLQKIHAERQKKKMEIDEESKLVKARMEKQKKENELKEQELEPTRVAIQSKERFLRTLKADPIFEVSLPCFQAKSFDLGNRGAREDSEHVGRRTRESPRGDQQNQTADEGKQRAAGSASSERSEAPERTPGGD